MASSRQLISTSADAPSAGHFFRRSEAPAVFGWHESDMAGEGAAKHVGVGEAATCGDMLWGILSSLQQSPRRRDPCLLGPGRRRDADLMLE